MKRVYDAFRFIKGAGGQLTLYKFETPTGLKLKDINLKMQQELFKMEADRTKKRMDGKNANRTFAVYAESKKENSILNPDSSRMDQREKDYDQVEWEKRLEFHSRYKRLFQEFGT